MAAMVDVDMDIISSATETIAGIEAKEQEVINHLRTAGLRQSSETALVADILKIRKERRRVFAAMQSKLLKVVDKNEDAETELRSRRSESQKERAQHAAELEELRGNLKDQHQEQAAYMKRKFEGKLKELNGKFESYLEGKEKEHAQALEAARKYSAKQELDAANLQSDNENMRLIKSLRGVTSENGMLKAAVSQRDETIARIKTECVTIHTKLEEETERRRRLEKRLGELSVASEALTNKLHSERGYARELSNALDQQQEERSVATESLDRAHAHEMATLEAKVRVALQAKDEQAHALSARCVHLETELESIRSSLSKMF
jgi:hypothetical protein